jgi:hypothetical protein
MMYVRSLCRPAASQDVDEARRHLAALVPTNVGATVLRAQCEGSIPGQSNANVGRTRTSRQDNVECMSVCFMEHAIYSVKPT